MNNNGMEAARWRVRAAVVWATTTLGALGGFAALSGCAPTNAAGGGPGGPPPVSVVGAVTRDVQEFDEYSARLEAPETVDLRARVGGTLEAVHFRDGQRVRRGDLLFTIDSRVFAAELARAQAQRNAAQTALELSRAEIARAEKLLPMQAVSQQEIDQLRAGVRNAEANLAATGAAVRAAELNVGYTRITSPITGRVGRSNVTAGNLVGAGDPVLATVVSTERVYAYFDASETTFLRYVRAAQDGSRPSSRETANPVAMGLANEQGFPHQGRMDFVDNRLNPATGSIRGRAVFDNKAGLFTPGLSARIKLVGSAPYNATLIPERAITTDQTRKVVLVVGNNNMVEPREVQLGALIDGMRVVKGLKTGERVIVEGQQRAFPGAPVTPQALKTDARGMPLPPAQQAQPPAPAKG
jgi:RND family efflux transporter MFP subunit